MHLSIPPRLRRRLLGGIVVVAAAATLAGTATTASAVPAPTPTHAVSAVTAVPSSAATVALTGPISPNKAMYPLTFQACGFDSRGWSKIYCASATSINPGSRLRVHKAPNYTSGYAADPTGGAVNGMLVDLKCWTTGAGDIDGHGDTYWFLANFDGQDSPFTPMRGYVNDWYVQTGSANQWKSYTYQGRSIQHC